MVKGLSFQKTHIICGNHGEDRTIEMVFREGATGMSAFYSCPKYISELKRENDLEGRSCFNRLGTTDYMKMLEILSDEKVSDDSGGGCDCVFRGCGRRPGDGRDCI